MEKRKGSQGAGRPGALSAATKKICGRQVNQLPAPVEGVC